MNTQSDVVVDLKPVAAGDCGIYCIKNTADGKIYIGQSNNMQMRLGCHRSDLKWNRHSNNHLQSAFNKHGKDSFEFSVLEVCEKNALDLRERQLIMFHFAMDDRFGYNQESGGKIFKHFSEATIKKMSQSQKNRAPASEETRRRLSENAKTHWTPERRARQSTARKGKPLSEEHCKKIGDIHRGLKHTEETKKRMSIAALNRPPVSEETRQKISLANTGRVFSEETRKKISEAHKGKHVSEETKRRISVANTGTIVTEETRKKLSLAGKGRVASEEAKRRISEAKLAFYAKKRESTCDQTNQTELPLDMAAYQATSR